MRSAYKLLRYFWTHFLTEIYQVMRIVGITVDMWGQAMRCINVATRLDL